MNQGKQTAFSLYGVAGALVTRLAPMHGEALHSTRLAHRFVTFSPLRMLRIRIVSILVLK